MSVSRLYKSCSTSRTGLSTWAKVGWSNSKLKTSRSLSDMKPGGGSPRLSKHIYLGKFWVSFNPTCVLAHKNNSHLCDVKDLTSLLCITPFYWSLQKCLRFWEGWEGCSCTPVTQWHINGMVRTSVELQYFSFRNNKNLKHNYPNKSF